MEIEKIENIYERKIIDLLMSNPKFTRKEIFELLKKEIKVSQGTVYRYFGTLQKKGLIIKVGKAREVPLKKIKDAPTLRSDVFIVNKKNLVIMLEKKIKATNTNQDLKFVIP